MKHFILAKSNLAQSVYAKIKDGLNSFFIFFGLDVGKSYSIIFYELRLFALLIWMCLTSKNDRAQETGIEEGILDILLNNNL